MRGEVKSADQSTRQRPTLSVNEAAYLAGVSVRTANQAIDRGQVQLPRSGRRCGRSKRTLGVGDAVYLRIQYALSADVRPRCYQALEGRSVSELPHTVEVGDVGIDVSRAIEEVARRLTVLDDIRQRVELNPAVHGGEPVFRDTRVPVHAIARKLELGASDDELLEDYPRLAGPDIELARLFAEIYPRQGRPPA